MRTSRNRARLDCFKRLDDRQTQSEEQGGRYATRNRDSQNLTMVRDKPGDRDKNARMTLFFPLSRHWRIRAPRHPTVALSVRQWIRRLSAQRGLLPCLQYLSIDGVCKPGACHVEWYDADEEMVNWMGKRTGVFAEGMDDRTGTSRRLIA